MLDPIAHAARLRELFDHAPQAPTVGVEEEVMLLDPHTLELLPRARELLAGLGADPAEVKLELPASHLELASAPCSTVEELMARLQDARARLCEGLAGQALAAAAGVHPFAGAEGALNRTGRYELIGREYGWTARRQLICGLHVHVKLSGGERVLAVYNALRSHLPEIAALAANASVYEGRDSGMASVRPAIAAMLPRQGVPPPLESWEHYAAELAWAARAGRLHSVREWWWELRPHPELGTLEVRVPDSQARAAQAGAVAAMAASLVLWPAQRHDGGDLPAHAPSWRIAENRFAAARSGLAGYMVDLHSGRRIATRDRLHALLEDVRPGARLIGAERALSGAHELVEENGSERSCAICAAEGPRGLARYLSECFLG